MWSIDTESTLIGEHGNTHTIDICKLKIELIQLLIYIWWTSINY